MFQGTLKTNICAIPTIRIIILKLTLQPIYVKCNLQKIQKSIGNHLQTHEGIDQRVNTASANCSSWALLRFRKPPIETATNMDANKWQK